MSESYATEYLYAAQEIVAKYVDAHTPQKVYDAASIALAEIMTENAVQSLLTKIKENN